MYIFLKKANILTNIINSIKDLVDQGTFTCKKDSFEFKSLDKSHVVYIHLHLKTKNFDEYKFNESDIENEEELKNDVIDGVEIAEELLNVNISSIATILKWVKNDECLIWKSLEKVKMTFIIGSEQKKIFN